MIIEYHRPQTLDEALKLLQREGVRTVPIGGGTSLRRILEEDVAAVDLQALSLNTVQARGNRLYLGATCTLQQLLEQENMAPALIKAIRHEATHNLRQVATVVGSLLASDGRSPLATVMLALDARLTLSPGEETINIGDLLPVEREILQGRLVTQIDIPRKVQVAYEYVARTPADRPIVCVAAARWPSGRTRVALGGYGSTPSLALDGPEPDGAELAARDVYQNAGDEWASAEYRQDVAGTLACRCLEQLLSSEVDR